MSVNNKHLAAILLGAAAAFGAYKDSTMTEEEKKKIADSLKDKFHKLKDEAEGGADSVKTHFDDLKNKAGDLLKEHFPNAEQHFHDFFKTDTKTETPPGTGSASQIGL